MAGSLRCCLRLRSPGLSWSWRVSCPAQRVLFAWAGSLKCASLARHPNRDQLGQVGVAGPHTDRFCSQFFHPEAEPVQDRRRCHHGAYGAEGQISMPSALAAGGVQL